MKRSTHNYTKIKNTLKLIVKLNNQILGNLFTFIALIKFSGPMLALLCYKGKNWTAAD